MSLRSNFGTTDPELIQLQELADRVVFDLSPSQRLRELVRDDATMDTVLWRTLADSGLVGLQVPETFGGSGATIRHVAIVTQSLAKQPSLVPYITSVWGSQTALLNGESRTFAEQWLPKSANGEATGTVVDPAIAVANWERTVDGRHRLTARIPFILNLLSADFFVILASASTGDRAWFGLPVSSLSGIQRLPLYDGSRNAGSADLSFSVGQESMLASPDRQLSFGKSLKRAVRTAIAIDAAAACRQVLQFTVDYASVRHQFGHPIGTFQAVKHACADMHNESVIASAAAEGAVDQMIGHPSAFIEGLEGIDQADHAAALAQDLASDAFSRIAGKAMQLHGGIGFTWEHDLHFFLKRAKLNEVLFRPTPGTVSIQF